MLGNLDRKYTGLEALMIYEVVNENQINNVDE